MRNYTTVGMPNSIMAQEFISDKANLVAVGFEKFADHVSLKKWMMTAIIDSFMARHPRGKGTKGSRLLRDFYAACYIFKLKSSRKQYYMDQRGNTLPMLSAALKCALYATGPRPAVVKMTEKQSIALYQFGLLEGEGDSLWLSDYGIMVQKNMMAADKKRECDLVRNKVDVMFDTCADSQVLWTLEDSREITIGDLRKLVS